MTVIKPGPKFEILAENELGEATSASPAIYDGHLFLRGEEHLFCIAKNSRASSQKANSETKDITQ